MELAPKVGIRHLRLVREPIALNRRLGFSSPFGFIVFAFFHQFMTRRALPHLQQAGILHNDYIFGVLQTARVNERYLSALLPALPEGISEVYSHPSASSEEFQALIIRSVAELTREPGIRLIRYQDLPAVVTRAPARETVLDH
jgi:hypothetical protein